AVPAMLLYQSQSKLRQNNQSLKQQIDGLVQVTMENERLSNLVAQAREVRAIPTNELSELLKLRGEVGSLRRQLADATKVTTKKTASTTREEVPITPEEEMKRMGIAFADNNQGYFPTNFDQALPFLAEEAKVEANLKPG